MTRLIDSLKQCDPAILDAIARYWGIDPKRMGDAELIETLHDIMLTPESALEVWERLDDKQRGALQTILGSVGGKLTLTMQWFEALHGEIRKMGAGAIERENPVQNPQSTAEALFYRGLIFERYEKAESGMRPVVYVPSDLAAVLPSHKTAYENLEDEPDESMLDEDAEMQMISSLDAESMDDIIPADTTIVDDITTLLGYVQVHGGGVEKGDLADDDRDSLLSHLLYDDPERLAFLFRLAVTGGLLDVQEGRVHTRRAEARRWLEGKRAAQLKWLADAWLKSAIYRELWHVPGLHPEPTGWPYDPIVARGAFLEFLADFVPKQAWWSLDEFIKSVKETEPDFQRPGGDYDSWYIRSDAGEYLSGFESWDAVEGALLEFYLVGPMHWLGMVDLAEDAARLTAYGRAFVSGQTWPVPPEEEEKIQVQPDGTLLATRRVPRIDRFQAMRFTSWGEPASGNAPYTYHLNAGGVQRAADQGITGENIVAFLSRMLDGAPVPEVITRLLATWQGGPATSASIEQLMVLRTTAPETLDFILDKPALRRYLGARLGEMAAIVRADQWEALRDALGEHGIDVQIME